MDNFKSLFFDSEGTFVWAGIAAIVTLISVLSSLFFSILSYKNTVNNLKQQKSLAESKIDADLKAKARIEWINQVRELTSIYISELSKLNLVIEDMLSISEFYKASKIVSEIPPNKKILDEKFFQNIESMKKNRNSINEYSEKILLYFSEKDDHKKIEELIKLIPESYKFYIINLENNLPSNFKIDPLTSYKKEIQKNITEIRHVFRQYLKDEWDKAKEGK